MRTSRHGPLAAIGLALAAWMAYLVLFLGGTALLGPAIDRAAMSPADQAASGKMALVVAAIDLAIVGIWVSRSRLRGWRLWLVTAAVTYGVKTFSSQLETWYFVKTSFVPPEMLPHLFAMTLPLCVIWPALLVLAFGPEKSEAPPPLGHAPASLAARIATAGCVLYPAVFFLAGYWIAWRQPAVRAYYGGPEVPLGMVAHYAAMLGEDPLVLPFEMARGLLWVAMAWPVLRYTRGPWWAGGLLFATMMALVQNDLHLLPNPLMPSEVRFWHFVETSSSNFVFALATAALLAPRRAP